MVQEPKEDNEVSSTLDRTIKEALELKHDIMFLKFGKYFSISFIKEKKKMRHGGVPFVSYEKLKKHIEDQCEENHTNYEKQAKEMYESGYFKSVEEEERRDITKWMELFTKTKIFFHNNNVFRVNVYVENKEEEAIFLYNINNSVDELIKLYKIAISRMH